MIFLEKKTNFAIDFKKIKKIENIPSTILQKKLRFIKDLESF